MKTLLVALNAKYVHSSLALRYLKNYCQEISNVIVKEYTINDSLDFILSNIYEEKAETVAFSCYIWNIDMVLWLAENLKKVAPATTIIFGGPEVSYDPEALMQEHHFIDYIIAGEGESAFKQLMGSLSPATKEQASKEQQESGLLTALKSISGLTFRMKENIISNPMGEVIKDLDAIPSPYELPEDLKGLDNKIIYYESSRGCPFNCQYCLSSTLQGVRFFSIERVKRDLSKLMEIGVKQVKFVDRTFNCHKEFTMQVMQFIKENGRGINFHFEIAADLLDEPMLEFLSTVPPGLFQFEIGVQSTNPATIEAIQRKTNLTKVFHNVEMLKRANNIHLHLDLIAGLPYEDYETFKKSFDEVFSLRPHQLQLGFLKLLKGSGVRTKEQDYGYQYQSQAPYQVLSSKWISYEELIRLHDIEELVEKYHNSGAFYHSIEFILNNIWTSPFEFFEDFTAYWRETKLHFTSHSQNTLYNILVDYYRDRNFHYLQEFIQVLKFDLLSRNRTLNLPEWAGHELEDSKQKVWDFLGHEEKVAQVLPNYQGKKAKEIVKTVHYGVFNVDIELLLASNYKQLSAQKQLILFDYQNRDIISNNAHYYIINE